MDFIFADDSSQPKPSRLGAGRLVAIGGIHVPAPHVGTLERRLEALCSRWGFPAAQQFKWSPGKRENFMRTQLVGDRRDAFYEDLFTLARSFEVQACVVVADSNYNHARSESESHEADVTALFLERVSSVLESRSTDGVVVIATPSGGSTERESFLAQCLGLVDTGTEYRSLANLPLGVFMAHSRRMRVLQLADVVASCTVARISGEPRYTPVVFDLLKPMLRRVGDRVGGFGVKLHPEYVYGNLYYWLLGDSAILREGTQRKLPDPALPFSDHPNEALTMGELMRQRSRGSRKA